MSYFAYACKTEGKNDISRLRLAPGKSDANDCSRHIGTPVTHYCQKCQHALCSKCKTNAHVAHPTIQITEKYQEITRNLKNLLKDCRAQKQNIKHQLIEIETDKLHIETSTQMAIKEMEQQRLIVVQDIMESFEEQINRINRTKDKELKDIDVQVIRLKQHDRQRKDIENCASNLIDRSKTPAFITEASDFLNYNRLKKVPAKKGSIGEHPTFKVIQDQGDRRIYVEDKILGYFATEDEYQHRFKKSSMTVEAHIADLKKFGSSRSVGGDSAATAIASTSSMPGLLHGISQAYLPVTDINSFEGSALKAFTCVFFSDNTLWISGWNRNWLGIKTLVILNVDLPEYNILKKEKKMNLNADMPTIIALFDDKIIFAVKSGKEVFSFNPETSTFETIYRRPNLRVAAMCSTDSHVCLLSQKQPDFVHIFNSRCHREEKFPTGLSGLHDCIIDMCVLKSPSFLDHKFPSDYTIVISTSSPHGSVRAVTKQGLLWMLDGEIQSLDAAFSPCCASSGLNGDIYAGDKENDKVKA